MKVAFTGPPCGGKSSVFDNLYLRGWVKMPEVARFWLNFMEHNKLPHYREQEFFQQLIEINHIVNYTEVSDSVIFDRTLPDEIAYRRYFCMPVPDTLIEDCNRFRVDKVFIFPFWEEIYKNDGIRIETPEQAMQLDKLILDAYTEVGYEPIIVPKTSILERVEFIKSHIEN